MYDQRPRLSFRLSSFPLLDELLKQRGPRSINVSLAPTSRVRRQLSADSGSFLLGDLRGCWKRGDLARFLGRAGGEGEMMGVLKKRRRSCWFGVGVSEERKLEKEVKERSERVIDVSEVSSETRQ